MIAALVVLLAGAGAAAACRWQAGARSARLRLLRGSTNGSSARAGEVRAPARMPARWQVAVDRLVRGRSVDRGLDRALPDALADLASAVRAGRSVVAALGEAGAAAPQPLRVDLEQVVLAVARGAPLADALAGWARRRSSSAVAIAVAGLQLATDVGGAEAACFDRLADTVRERVAVLDDLRAASAQARASAVVLTVVPVGFAALSGLLDPGTVVATLGSPVGVSCLVSGVALDVLGGWWMLRLSGGRR